MGSFGARLEEDFLPPARAAGKPRSDNAQDEALTGTNMVTRSDLEYDLL